MIHSISTIPPQPPSSSALTTLVAQHDALRVIMHRCEGLATDQGADLDDERGELAREVKGLRIAFDAHNQFEEELLRPMIFEHDAFATVRLDRMVEDHVGEHQMFRDRLASSAVAVLRDVFDSLRSHLAAEERYLTTSL